MKYLCIGEEAVGIYGFTKTPRFGTYHHITYLGTEVTQCGIIAPPASNDQAIPLNLVCIHCRERIAPIREHFPIEQRP